MKGADHIIKVVLAHDTLSTPRKLQSQILVLGKHNGPKQLHPTLKRKTKLSEQFNNVRKLEKEKSKLT